MFLRHQCYENTSMNIVFQLRRLIFLNPEQVTVKQDFHGNRMKTLVSFCSFDLFCFIFASKTTGSCIKWA